MVRKMGGALARRSNSGRDLWIGHIIYVYGGNSCAHIGCATFFAYRPTVFGQGRAAKCQRKWNGKKVVLLSNARPFAGDQQGAIGDFCGIHLQDILSRLQLFPELLPFDRLSSIFCKFTISCFFAYGQFHGILLRFFVE